MGNQPFQLEADVHLHDQEHSNVGGGNWMERAEGVESEYAKLQNQALRKCTGASYGSSGTKVEKIAGIEAVDTIMEAAQRFFARAVADPSAVGNLWLASLNPNNIEEEWVEEGGRD